jgi:hypothetical protein
MKLSLPSFAGWRSGALAAFTRFPWNILCGATGAACLITLIHTEHNEWLEGHCVRLAMAAAIGMPLFFSLHILRERIPKFTPWPIETVGLFVLAGWFLAQPASPLRLPGIIWIQWLLFWRHCTVSLPCPRISRGARAWASGNLTGVYLSGFVSPPFTRLS